MSTFTIEMLAYDRFDDLCQVDGKRNRPPVNEPGQRLSLRYLMVILPFRSHEAAHLSVVTYMIIRILPLSNRLLPRIFECKRFASSSNVDAGWPMNDCRRSFPFVEISTRHGIYEGELVKNKRELFVEERLIRKSINLSQIINN